MGTNLDTIKSGVKTSEFWLAMLTALFVAFNQFFGLGLDTEKIMSIVGVVMSYILSRGLAKKNG